MIINVNVEVPDGNSCYECPFLKGFISGSWRCNIFRCDLDWMGGFTGAKCLQCLNATRVEDES